MNIFLKSFGCKVNDAEDELILSSLIASGYSVSASLVDAEILLVNSCAVTETASKKVIEYIRSAKANYPDLRIVATGCLASDSSVDLRAYGADNVVSNASKSDIVGYIITCSDSDKKFNASSDLLSGVALDPVHKTRAFFKIQDGCDAECSYCIIPKLRGPSRAVKIEQLEADFNRLLKAGYKEIVLVGIHIGMYGKEFGSDLTELLKKLISVDGDFRIRLSSIEVTELTDDMLKLIATSSGKIAPHLHIPLQSGSDKILQLMNRGYLSKEYVETVLKAKEYIKDLTVGSDVIVGFPNETDDDFLLTIDTLQQAGTELMHIFPYSDRSGTSASKMSGKITTEIKHRRVATLTAFASEKRDTLYQSFVGRKLKVLAERGSKGHSENYLLVQSEDELIKNNFYDIKILRYSDGKLFGKIRSSF